MSFANPLGLLFALVALPVIALHLLKPRRVEAVVSSSMLWNADTVGSTAASPWQRLPPTLLLLLQLLLVALGALLLANPITSEESGLAEHTVVVLDTSASMAALDGSPDRFADAKQAAIALIDEIPEGGRLSLVAAGTTPSVRVSATTDVASFEAAVRALRVGDGPADLSEAMTLANGLETPDARLGIVLISDGGHTAPQLAALPTGVTHRLVGDSDVNHAITSLRVQRVDGGLEATVTSEVTGGGAVTTPLRFDVDDLTQAVVDITIEPSVPNQTTVILPEGERIVARLGGDDLLGIDNTAYAVARSREDLSIAIHGEADVFLTTLLETLDGVTIVDPTVETPEIDIFVGQAVPEDTLRPFLAIAPPTGVAGVQVTGEVEAPSVTRVESSDPLLTGLDLSRVRIANAQTVESATAEVLVGSPGAPLVLRGRRGGVPFLYLSFDVADSTLPVDLVFPVLGQRIVEELGGAVTVPAAIEVGDLITPPVGRDTVVISPSGIELSRPGGAGAVTVTEPGFWRVAPAGGAERMVAVTLGVEESELEPLPVAPTDPRPLRAGEDPPTTDTSWRWILVMAALGLGLWEWLTIRARRGVPRWQWRSASVLRIASAVALVVALLGVALPLSGDDVVTVFVLDRSDSVGRTGASQGTNISSAAAAVAPDDARMGVVVSADGARIEQLLTSVDRSNGIGSAIIDGDRSDLASGLRLAGALVPDDSKRRVVVVSDGRATGEDPESEALALGVRGVPVDYVLLETTAGGDAAVVGINAPSQVDEAAQVPIEVVVESTVASAATVTLRRDGEPVAATELDLEIGSNRVSFVDVPNSSALVSYTATIDMVGDERPQNDTARTTVDVDGRARVLVVEGTSEAGDVLAAALESAGIDVDLIEPGAVPSVDRLIGYDSVVLADVAMSQLSNDQVDGLVTATRQLGRGLVTIGGPQSYGMGQYLSLIHISEPTRPY